MQIEYLLRQARKQLDVLRSPHTRALGTVAPGARQRQSTQDR